MIPPLSFIQTDFSGGMNLFAAEVNIGINEYGKALNVRNRHSILTTIPAPVEDTSAPNGLKQGIYAFDKYVLLFNSGRAYFKDIVLDTPWTKIEGLSLTTDVEFIYTQAVPASVINKERKLDEANVTNGTSTESNVSVTNLTINGTEAGLVCQDGVRQPFLISSDGTARQLQKYSEWSLTNREYVPIISKMAYINGILFGVAPDGVTLYRSVSGRPLDFVVNIDINGNKGGDASTTSYAVGYSPITCLLPLSSGFLFVGTSTTCHPVEFNYDSTIFAEPTFKNSRTFNAGVTNQFSFIDILSDYVFIDADGIRSFNAINAEQNEGRNSLFSANLSRALEGITQSATCAIVFDNYAIFSIDTIYGNLLAVYDNSRERWVCFDDLGIGAIKQFAIATQANSPTLYAITASKVYKLYSGITRLEAEVNLRALTSNKASSGIKLSDVWPVFDGGTTPTEAEVVEKVDNVEQTTIALSLSTGVNSLTFNFLSRAKQGWKIQPILRWQNDASLLMVEALASETTTPVSFKQIGGFFSATN